MSWDSTYCAAFVHVRRRVETRYGLELTERDYRRLRNAIASGRCRMARKLNGDRGEFHVPFRGRVVLRLVYDYADDLIVTALPAPE